MAVATMEVLADRGFNITRDNIVLGLEMVSWPGRFQVLRKKPLVIADGAHNPASARQLKQSLTDYFKRFVKRRVGGRFFDRAILVIGASSDKDISGIASELSSLFDLVIATRSRHPRAMATAPIMTEFSKHDDIARAYPTIRIYWEQEEGVEAQTERLKKGASGKQLPRAHG